MTRREVAGHEHANVAYFAFACIPHMEMRDEILRGVDADNPSPEVRKRLEAWHSGVARCVSIDVPDCCSGVGIADGIICFLGQMENMPAGDEAFWSQVHSIATKARLSLEAAKLTQEGAE